MKLKNISGLMMAMVCIALTSCGKEDVKQKEVIEFETATQPTETVMIEQVDTEEMLNQFIEGEVAANGNDLYYKDSFFITDLPIETDDFESFYIGDFIDLDNDGENELILDGPYGGMYLDVYEGCVNVFAIGDGTASTLSYVEYENATWIVHSDTAHVGRESYILEKYNGIDHKVDEIQLCAEYYENETDYYDENSTFLFRNQTITMEEYEKLRYQIFGYPTSQNYYSVCTSKSKDEVESFAKQMVNYFEQENWEGLSDIIRYPITINETYYASKEAFLEKDWSNVFTREYIESVVNAETTNLFCNWSGICFADGLVWLGQTGDELCIDALNFYDETQKEEPSEGMLGHWVLDYEKTEKELKKHSSLQELFGTGIHAGSSLDIREDNQFSMSLAIAIGISGTYEIEEDVIKIHYSDERGNEGDDIISYVMVDEQQYIISTFAEEEMYWKKLSD